MAPGRDEVGGTTSAASNASRLSYCNALFFEREDKSDSEIILN